MIIKKSPREVKLMKEAGRIVATVFEQLGPKCKPGVSTWELDQLAGKIIRSEGATPTFLGYGGFPGNICISVNDTLIHGIPSKDIILKEGDVISLDVGATKDGYIADAARTFPVGEISPEAEALIEATEASFWNAVINYAKPGGYVGDISHAIQSYLEPKGFGVPREYAGHGVGVKLHEDPFVPNYGYEGSGPRLRVGMTLAIEPMVTLGSRATYVLDDEWTVKTLDGKLSAHYENTIVITEDGFEVLTVLDEKELKKWQEQM